MLYVLQWRGGLMGMKCHDRWTGQQVQHIVKMGRVPVAVSPNERTEKNTDEKTNEHRRSMAEGRL